MANLLDMFDGPMASLMASVVAFNAFFLIGRVAKARQGVAFAFAFTPLLMFFVVEMLVAT
jgi:hypothetical protein